MNLKHRHAPLKRHARTGSNPRKEVKQKSSVRFREDFCRDSVILTRDISILIWSQSCDQDCLCPPMLVSVLTNSKFCVPRRFERDVELDAIRKRAESLPIALGIASCTGTDPARVVVYFADDSYRFRSECKARMDERRDLVVHFVDREKQSGKASVQ